MAPPVVTFDAGQTVIDLDLDFLARRLAGRGTVVSVDALRAATPAAWKRYDELVDASRGHPWKELMHTLLAGAGVEGPAPLVDWLWDEQPRANLWRKPIDSMVALARELRERGVRVGVLSNSEGGLEDLFVEIAIRDAFVAVIDSGRVGIEKPDRRIFDHTLEVLHAGDATVRVHIGDSWAADVDGALGAGWNAIWFHSRPSDAKMPANDPRVAVARSADDVRSALARFGV